MSNNLSPEKQVSLIQPILKIHVLNFSRAYGKKFKEDYSMAEHALIIDQKDSGELLKPYIIVKYWDIFDLFLKGAIPLFLFIERPLKGLVSEDPKFWYFFSAQAATHFFRGQSKKVRDFKKESIFRFPPPDVHVSLMRILVSMLNDASMPLLKKMEKADEMLLMSDSYPPRSEDESLKSVQKQVCIYTAEEIELLKKDIETPGKSLSVLQRRLAIVYNVCQRYFKTDNSMESQNFKKLLSEHYDQRVKGLELALKRLNDFINT